MTSTTSPKFGKLKTFLWPIHRSEYKKFIPMAFIFFLISFNYSILRTAKDTLIVTAPNSGAETIPYIKTWIMLPSAILITYLFTRISNKFTRDKVFYIMVGIFATFFSIFLILLYPARDILQPSVICSKLENLLPLGLHGLVALIRNWPFTLFYVMSELWGAVILSVLFWGFANDVTTIEEAKRFYALFGVGANLASIISGRTTMFLSSNIFNPHIPYGSTAWDQSILYLTSAVVIISLGIIATFCFLNKKLPQLAKEKEENLAKKLDDKAPKEKMTLRKNFLQLSKSKYLICIALIVLCYNITINLVEVIWKNQVKQLHPGANEFNMYMGQVLIMTGIVSTIVALFISGNFLRKFSWTFNALLTPIIVFLTGTLFFSFFILKGSYLTFFASLFGATPLAMSVFFGSLHNCLTRSSKFTLFDATKEMTFIPLDKDSRIKGKAAIDGIGSRIGKSSGSVIHQGLLIIFSTLTVTAPYIGFIFLGVVAVWFFAVKALGKQFTTLTNSIDKPSSLEEVKERLSLLQEKVQNSAKSKPEAVTTAEK